jgi:hypothetical protein
MKRLNRQELEGVIAHEMAHISNYDVLLATVAVVLAGTIVFLGLSPQNDLFWWNGPQAAAKASGQADCPGIMIVRYSCADFCPTAQVCHIAGSANTWLMPRRQTLRVTPRGWPVPSKRSLICRCQKARLKIRLSTVLHR